MISMRFRVVWSSLIFFAIAFAVGEIYSIAFHVLVALFIILKFSSLFREYDEPDIARAIAGGSSMSLFQLWGINFFGIAGGLGGFCVWATLWGCLAHIAASKAKKRSEVWSQWRPIPWLLICTVIGLAAIWKFLEIPLFDPYPFYSLEITHVALLASVFVCIRELSVIVVARIAT